MMTIEQADIFKYYICNAGYWMCITQATCSLHCTENSKEKEQGLEA